MLRLIIFLVFLIVSVWVGVEAVRHPGYVFLVYQPWMVQIPLWFALLALIVFFFLFYFLLSLVDRGHFLWFRIKSWFRFRHEQKLYSQTQQGLALLIEGRYKKAEHLLLKGVDKTQEPLINYLGAAKAAQELQAFDRRDLYLQQAHEAAPKADLAIGLTQVEFALQQKQFEQAYSTLQRLQKIAPRHPRLLRLLEKVYVHLHDWQSLLAMVPAMRKAKLLTKEDAATFEKNLYCEILKNSNKDLAELHHFWYETPRYLRKNPDVVDAYIKQIMHFSDIDKEVGEAIRGVLKHDYQADLVRIYGDLPFTNLNRQLIIVNAWLNYHGERPELLLVLGKLCVRLQLWGKAKEYFDRVLALGPNAEASLEYGKLLEHLDEPTEAIKKYRQGLQTLNQEDSI